MASILAVFKLGTYVFADPVQGISSRSHALRGNAVRDALRRSLGATRRGKAQASRLLCIGPACASAQGRHVKDAGRTGTSEPRALPSARSRPEDGMR